MRILAEQVDASELSSIRSIVAGVISIINDPTSTARDLKHIIEVDPPLTTRVLAMANSALYASKKKICDLEQAVIWIGYDSLKEIALSQKVCEIFAKGDLIEGYSRAALWKHSMAVAMLAKMIYRMEFGLRGEDIYICGLLHDIGLIVEDQFAQSEFISVIREWLSGRSSLPDAEMKVFGFDHPMIGSAILERWDIPQEIVISICRHHDPFTVEESFARMTATLFLADTLCQREGFGRIELAPSLSESTLSKCMKLLGLKPMALGLLIRQLKERIGEMEHEGLFRG